MIETFSGTRPFHPTVWADTDADDAGDDHAAYLTELIESGRCPRCVGPLPTMPEYPAGSRITHCRSIPICGPCGSDEAYESMGQWGMSAASEWPVDVEDIEQRRVFFEATATIGILTIKDGLPRIITEDGASDVINPRNTGGWACQCPACHQ
jgi:hypothetical protein